MTSNSEAQMNRLIELIKTAYQEQALSIEGPAAASDGLSSFSVRFRDDLPKDIHAQLLAICQPLPV